MSKMIDELDEIARAEYSRIHSKVQKLMGWDDQKTTLWFITSNPHFGDIQPLKLIKMGRSEKVNKFVDAAIENNKPAE